MNFFYSLKSSKNSQFFFCFTTSSFLAVKKSSCSLLKTMFQNFFLQPPPFSDVFIIKLFPSTWFFHHAAHDLTMNKKRSFIFQHLVDVNRLTDENEVNWRLTLGIICLMGNFLVSFNTPFSWSWFWRDDYDFTADVMSKMKWLRT